MRISVNERHRASASDVGSPRLPFAGECDEDGRLGRIVVVLGFGVPVGCGNDAWRDQLEFRCDQGGDLVGGAEGDRCAGVLVEVERALLHSPALRVGFGAEVGEDQVAAGDEGFGGYDGCNWPHQDGLSWPHPRVISPHGWAMTA